MDGELLWKKDLGVLKSAAYNFPPAEWGFASSPVLHDGKVIVQCDVIGDSFLAVFDAQSGKEIWRQARKEFPTWGTPTVIQRGDKGHQVVVNGFKHMGGYDLATGEALWHLQGGGDVPIPTPFEGHGLIFLANAHGASAPVYAVRLTASGDVSLAKEETSSAAIAYRLSRVASYQNTPVVYGDELYVCRDNGGRLICFDAHSGEERYRQRLEPGGNVIASPVAADGKVYFTTEEGEVHVVKAGPSYELLAVNPLGEPTLATPAISAGVIFFRGRHHVVAIGPPSG